MLSLYRRHLKKCPHASSGVRYAGFIRNDRAHAVSGPFQWRAQLARPRKIGFVRSKRVTVWQQRDKTRSNRRNARKSTGPKTTQGKAVVSRGVRPA